ncbi:MAG TPA: class I SAM-dependent methyltransferase [Gaiellaceae bacterium]|nr:class I SAM-dependent methyltransferase [Gaiellaceae bacterium]
MWTSDTAYDNFMGRFSARLAPVFADFAGIDAGSRVLDVGAGTGALTAELVRRGAQVAAAEPSPAFVAALHERFGGVDARRAVAEDLPWPDESFDAALAQLVVAFMDDAPAGVREMRRVAGTVAVCMWDRENMEMLAAINRTRDALGMPREDSRFRSRAEIEELLGDGAESELLAVDAGYADFEDFWTALVGGAGPAGVWASSLEGEQRATARAELFRQLDEPDGPFTLTGRAWASRLRPA